MVDWIEAITTSKYSKDIYFHLKAKLKDCIGTLLAAAIGARHISLTTYFPATNVTIPSTVQPNHSIPPPHTC